MTKEVASAFIDRSLTNLSGSSEALFPAVTFGSIQERIIFNPNASNAIWINLLGGTAAANVGGNIKLAAGEGITTQNTNAITVIGTAGDDVTALER